jgi:twitching motility protein PilT
MDISELLAFVVKNKASDLHLSSGLPPMIRVHGDIRRINLPALEHKDVHAMVYDIMNDGQRKFSRKTSSATFPSQSPISRVFASMRSSSNAAPARCSGPFRPRC